MSEAPYLLTLHLIGGQSIDLLCTTFEIVPPGIEHDEHGNHVETPFRLDYTPVDDWQQTLGFVDFRGVVAIEVHRSAEVIAAERMVVEAG